ncbi:MAG: PTS mannose transporter subunit IIAB [Thermoprotei archaeon]|nr:MAG: PTS mannose transporter subunit IIAB [Thermoprotei archaeon]
MTGVVIVSHGRFVDGILDSVRMLLGSDVLNKVTSVVLTEMDSVEGLVQRVKEAIEKVRDENGVLVLVDLFGGTPSRAAAMIVIENPNVEVVAGLNLPMLLQVLLNLDKPANELAKLAVEAGREGIIHVSERIREQVLKTKEQ